MNTRKSKVKIEWSASFAYAIGLIASDGNISTNGRNFNLTSKDLENVENFRQCLGVDNKIGLKSRGGSEEKKYFCIQIGDINFCDFLNSIGLTKNKSKSIQKVDVPYEFFRDFLRGCHDGDGSIYYFIHPESRKPQYRLSFASASPSFLEWMKQNISLHLGITGGWVGPSKGCHMLRYAKSDSLRILNFMYYVGVRYFLSRKYQTALQCAGDVMVAMRALGARAVRRGGSSPLPRTTEIGN